MPDVRSTAFLVIHGVGPHTPYGTCDSFVRGFYEVLQEKPSFQNQQIPVKHKIKQRKDWAGKGIPWVQNYVSMELPGKDEVVDFYEYFWDIYMVHEARFAEAYKMLSTASKGANRFYKRLTTTKSALNKYGRKTKLGTGVIEFRPTGYFRLLGPVFTFLSIVLPYIPFAMKILDKWAGTQFPVLKQMFSGFSALMKEPVPDFIGDLVRYLDLDPRSEHHETRRRIIDGALDELRELMADDYDRIIVVGHSLGSVIAYDVLNRVIQETNVVQKGQAIRITKTKAEKITALVTCGSPLDKIAFFFRERVAQDKKVQHQVLSNLHGFRTLTIPEDRSEIDIGNPMAFKMNDTLWLNFYHPEDLISGKLDFYDLRNQSFQHLAYSDGNIEIQEYFNKLRAHSCYWGEHQGRDEGKRKGTNQMYEDIIKEFFP